MGRSFYRPDVQPAIENWGAGFFHAKSKLQYRMIRRDGRLYQQRYEAGETNLFEQQVDYVIGSGNHARSYLHREANGELTQLPVTWYTQENRWQMSPGYDRARHFDFSRRIDHGCMFCHNAYPRVPDGSDRYGAIGTFPADLPSGIDCQRCHGPGGSHVELAGRKGPAEKIRAAIVNPRRLSTSRQLDICMQCHLETTSATLPASTRRFGRAAYSFRPGEPLADYIVHFDHPAGSGHEGKFEINGAAYRLRKSPCFLKSEGRLTCTSCHDAHRAPRGLEAATHFRTRCMSCHPQVSAAAHPHPESSDCAGCHMPKRRAQDAVHAVMTDHLVAKRLPRGDPQAKLEEQEAEYKGPVELYSSADLAEPDRDIYLGLALVAADADRKRGIQTLERIGVGRLPGKALAELAGAYVRDNRFADAIAAYRRAIEIEPGMALARFNLAQALERSGDIEAAQREHEQVARNHPTFPEVRFSLANLALKTGDRRRTEDHFREALRLRPTYAEAHNNLGVLLLDAGKLDEAASELSAALRIDPSYAEAHANRARLEAARGRMDVAIQSARRALEIDPAHLEARINLGRLLLGAGRAADAIAEFRKAIRQSPDSIEAHRSLGVALGESGDYRGASHEFGEVLRLVPNDAEAMRNLETARRLAR
jgi:tetratricopeptide (TPR) repeat protein